MINSYWNLHTWSIFIIISRKVIRKSCANVEGRNPIFPIVWSVALQFSGSGKLHYAVKLVPYIRHIPSGNDKFNVAIELTWSDNLSISSISSDVLSDSMVFSAESGSSLSSLTSSSCSAASGTKVVISWAMATPKRRRTPKIVSRFMAMITGKYTIITPILREY